ncbi:MAG: hypothetical protein Q9227_007886 [Pyrenula ochraceoflavens]
MTQPEVHELDPEGEVVFKLFRTVETFDELPPSTTSAAPPNHEYGGDLDPSYVTEEVHFKVSAKHMALASRVFKVLLQGHMDEARRLRTHGSVTCPLPDDNPDAFLIVLNIIHLRKYRIPEVISFEDLVHVGVLVDKYELHEAVEDCARAWISRLQDQAPRRPEQFGPNVVKWIFVSWVFRSKIIFQVVTKLAIRSSQKQLDTQELPVPREVIGELFHPVQLNIRLTSNTATIEECRCDAIKRAIELIDDLRENFLDNIKKCGYHCDAYALGLMIRACQSMDISDKQEDESIDNEKSLSNSFKPIFDLESHLMNRDHKFECKPAGPKTDRKKHGSSTTQYEGSSCENRRKTSNLVISLNAIIGDITGLALDDFPNTAIDPPNNTKKPRTS